MAFRKEYVTRLWALPLRFFLGALWLYHGLEKIGPDFGGIRGIVRVMAYGNAAHPGGNPIEPFRQFLSEIVLPNWHVFGAVIMISEILVGAALTLGAVTRLAAAAGILLQMNYWLGRGYLEWPFVYPAIVIAHVVLIWTAAGRAYGIDSRLHRRISRWLA